MVALPISPGRHPAARRASYSVPPGGALHRGVVDLEQVASDDATLVDVGSRDDNTRRRHIRLQVWQSEIRGAVAAEIGAQD
jgi:hypothetical protein